MVVDNKIAQQGEVKEVVVEEKELTPETVQAMEEFMSGLSEYFLVTQGWVNNDDGMKHKPALWHVSWNKWSEAWAEHKLKRKQPTTPPPSPSMAEPEGLNKIRPLDLAAVNTRLLDNGVELAAPPLPTKKLEPQELENVQKQYHAPNPYDWPGFVKEPMVGTGSPSAAVDDSRSEPVPSVAEASLDVPKPKESVWNNALRAQDYGPDSKKFSSSAPGLGVSETTPPRPGPPPSKPLPPLPNEVPSPQHRKAFTSPGTVRERASRSAPRMNMPTVAVPCSEAPPSLQDESTASIFTAAPSIQLGQDTESSSRSGPQYTHLESTAFSSTLDNSRYVDVLEDFTIVSEAGYEAQRARGGGSNEPLARSSGRAVHRREEPPLRDTGHRPRSGTASKVSKLLRHMHLYKLLSLQLG